MNVICCPSCGCEFDLLVVIADDAARKYIGLLGTVSPSLVGPLINYTRLFKPQKNRLSWGRAHTIMSELVGVIKTGRLAHNHAEYIVPVSAWVAGLEALCHNPPESLRLPLKSNGYLYSIVAGDSEKIAAKSEQDSIDRARTRSADDQATASAALANLRAASGRHKPNKKNETD